MTTQATATVSLTSTQPQSFEDKDDSSLNDAIILFFSSDPGRWLHLCVYYLLNPLTMAVAICTNGINVLVFLYSGLSDGMTVIFLGLSVSDLLYCSFALIGRLLNVVYSIFEVRPYLNTLHLAYVMSKWSGLWFQLSPLLTVFAAVQKCACVARPLTFRNFFTLRRSAISVAGLYIIVIVYYLPYLSVDQLVPYHDRYSNRTRLGYTMRSLSLAIAMDEIVGNVSRIVGPFVSQAIVIACVFIMTFKLRAAASARRKMTSPEMTPGNGEKQLGDGTPEGDAERSQAAEVKNANFSTKPADADLSTKELRVIRSVNIVCIIFIAGMAPTTLIEVLDSSITTFSDLGVLSSLYFFLSGIKQLVVVGSTAVNILVYYNYNTKYRNTYNDKFKTLYCCCSKNQTVNSF